MIAFDSPDAGTNGLMLGEILGRNAGDIAAEDVLWRFLAPRPPRPSTLAGLLNVSWE